MSVTLPQGWEQLVCFPRVSGDEVPRVGAHIGQGVFSPRERG